jgi:hypothetical protein
MMKDATGVTARSVSMFAAALAVLPGTAWCAYTCKAPGGGTIIRDYLPTECASVEIRELNPDGSLKRIIPPPRSAEQRKLEEEKDKRSADCAKQNDAQKQADEVLARRYALEDDLIAARDRALANEKARLGQQAQRQQELKTARARMEEAKASYKGRPIPDALKADFEANDSAASAIEHQIEATSSNIERLTLKYDADLKRYRDLVRGTAKPPCQMAE